MKEEFEKYVFNKKKVKLVEMANIGKVNDLVIQVYTDHNPPHYHVTKKDCFEVRLAIKDNSIISYKWQKNGKEISTKDIDKISKWLNISNDKKPKITNKDAIELFWDAMN